MRTPEKFRLRGNLEVDGLYTLAAVVRERTVKKWDRTLVKLNSYPITVPEARATADRVEREWVQYVEGRGDAR